jgi:hypothetical protein
MRFHTPISHLISDFVDTHGAPRLRRTGRIVHVEPGFLRVGCSPRRLIIAHHDKALYTVRSRGRRFGSWYVYFGW